MIEVGIIHGDGKHTECPADRSISQSLWLPGKAEARIEKLLVIAGQASARYSRIAGENQSRRRVGITRALFSGNISCDTPASDDRGDPRLPTQTEVEREIGLDLVLIRHVGSDHPGMNDVRLATALHVAAYITEQEVS